MAEKVTALSGHYRCLKCDRSWKLSETTEGRDMLPKSGCQCPFCGHLYVKWLNYGEK